MLHCNSYYIVERTSSCCSVYDHIITHSFLYWFFIVSSNVVFRFSFPDHLKKCDLLRYEVNSVSFSQWDRWLLLLFGTPTIHRSPWHQHRGMHQNWLLRSWCRWGKLFTEVMTTYLHHHRHQKWWTWELSMKSYDNGRLVQQRLDICQFEQETVARAMEMVDRFLSKSSIE